MQEFVVDVARTGACSIVTVVGELDIATAPQLVAALEGAVNGDSPQLVVDLLGTTFIDSTGLTTLFRAHKRLETEGSAAFSIVVGPDNMEVRRVVELMGFDEVFTIHESRAAAGCDEQES